MEKGLPPTALSTHPVCVSGRRACPPEEVGGSRGYDQRTLDQSSWRYVAYMVQANTLCRTSPMPLVEGVKLQLFHPVLRPNTSYGPASTRPR